MAYVDGFLLCLPKKNIKTYKKIASVGKKVWLDHGALDYKECVGDDLKTPGMLSFLKIAKPKAGETVVFSWIMYKSKAHRDSVNKKVMKDKRIAGIDPNKMPFDWKRMAYGGFKVLVG